MTRKAIPVCTGFIAGLYASYLLFASGSAKLSALGILFMACAVSAPLMLMAFKNSGRHVALFIISFAVGAGYLGGQVFLRQRPIENLSGSSAEVSGKVTYLNGGDSARLFVYGSVGGVPGGVEVYTDGFSGRVGDRVEFSADIIPLSSSAFFDEKINYLPDGIFAKARADEIKVVHAGGMAAKITEYSSYVAGEIRKTLPGARGELISAMVTGDRSAMSDSLSSALSRAGIGHIASVSGIHVSVAALALWAAMRKIRLPRALISASVIAYAFGFTVFAGMRISAIRAAVMISAAAAASVFRRRQDVLNTVSIAAALICIFSPYSVVDASFQLSFAGTFGIAVVYPAVAREFTLESSAAKALLASFCATVCTAPFMILHFNEISLITPAVNIFAVPILSMSIILGMIFAFTGCRVSVLCKISGAIAAPIIRFCDMITDLRAAYMPTYGRPAATLVFIAAAAEAAAYFLYKNIRYMSLFSILLTSALILLGGAYKLYDGSKPKLDIINFSDDSAAVLRYGGECVIIDLGGSPFRRIRDLTERLGLRPAAVIMTDIGASGAAYQSLPIVFSETARVDFGSICADISQTFAKICLGGSEVTLNSGRGIYTPSGATVYGGDGMILDGGILEAEPNGGTLRYKTI